MVKKNVLTPVLAGVLGLSIAGSGVGYFLVNKDGGSADKTKADKSAVKNSPKITAMAENISNTLDKAQDVISGEADYAYEGSVTISLGKAVTDDMGTDLQDFGMTVSSRQKGGNEGGEVALTYGGKKVVTIDQVYSRENSEEAYIRIPELSDAYVKVSRDDAEKFLEDDLGVDFNMEVTQDIDFDFDAEAFAADIQEYEQIVKDNFPAVKEEGTKSGDIDGVTYSYTSKSYDITGTDAQNIAVAVLEKVKTDSNIKSLYDQGIEEMYNSYSYIGDENADMPTYEENIQEVIDSLKAEDFADDDSKISLETYEDTNGNFMGFTLKPDGEDGELRYIVVSSDEAEGIDMFFDAGDGTEMVAYGALKSDGNAINGTYTIFGTEDGKETMKMVYSLTNVTTVGDNFSGSIRVDIDINDDYEKTSGWYEIVSSSTEDNVDVVFDFGMNGESAITMTVKSTKTEASDVELPGADAVIYDALDEEQLNKYLESCDLEGFQAKLKESLGDELYDQLFVSTTPDYLVEEGSWGNDYGWDDDFESGLRWESDDDFDWDQFDWDMNLDTDQPA